MDKTQLRKLQLIQVKMLDEVARICEKHHIRYYLISGTLLGAVRHQGFIPWDDDIDIGMPRRDYEEFLKIAQKELPKEYFLQAYTTEKEYPIHFAKVRNNNTTYMMINLSSCKINHGVCIDLAPLDGKPSFIGRVLLGVYKGVLARYRFKNTRNKSNIKEVLIKYLASKYTPFQINEKIKKLMSRYDFDRSKYVGNFFGVWREREIFPRDYFGKGTELQFEGKLYKCPEKYREYLTHLYGPNCLKIPERKHQSSHHGLLAVDLDKSYLKNETVLKFQHIIEKYPISFKDINQEDALVILNRMINFINELEVLPGYFSYIYDVLWMFPVDYFFQKLTKSRKTEIIEDKLSKNDFLRHLYLRHLFINKKYKEILKYTALEGMDVSYFLGRTYKELKKYDHAIFNLQKALQIIHSSGRPFFDQKNILISTYYHLGEIYYGRGERTEAKDYFYKCQKASNDMHIMANKYINKIENSKSHFLSSIYKGDC